MSYFGENIPKLGFGCMRFPKLENGEIDVETTKKMVDRFLEAGFTYFDTAYGYKDSEVTLKAALVDRHPRESYLLATKLPAWLGVKNAEEARQMFYTSLERTGAGYFDFYLLHNLGGSRTQLYDDYDLWNFVAEQKEKGLIKHIGFSFHDNAEALDKVLTAHPEVEFVQLQLNYADWESNSIQSKLCYKTALKHNKPIIVMEPVKGGLLANPPKTVREILKPIVKKASFASFALRYVASLDNIITVLSGMSNMEQLEDNIATFTDLKPFDASERGAAECAQLALSETPTIPCTKCNYCTKDCPAGIPIPSFISVLNGYTTFENLDAAKADYAWPVKRSEKHASDCIGCGNCESVCPQHIDIVTQMKKASELFD